MKASSEPTRSDGLRRVCALPVSVHCPAVSAPRLSVSALRLSVSDPHLVASDLRLVVSDPHPGGAWLGQGD
jgi:hypothetical protein